MDLSQVRPRTYDTWLWAFRFDGTEQSIVDLKTWINATHTAGTGFMPAATITYVNTTKFTVEFGFFFEPYDVHVGDVLVFNVGEIPGEPVTVGVCPATYGPVTETQFAEQYEAVS